jgi:hypothetical protein
MSFGSIRQPPDELTRMTFLHLQPATRVQFGLGAILPHSNTPSLCVAGFEDEDEDDDEYKRLLVNEVNQSGIAGWLKHCHPDSDEDGSREGNGSNLVASAQICALSRAFAVCFYRRFVYGWMLVRVYSQSFSQDSNRKSNITTAALALVCKLNRR